MLSKITPVAEGPFREAMSTSLIAAEWSLVFQPIPSSKQQLGMLEPQHVRIQTANAGIPQTGPGTWDFSTLDKTVLPLLELGDSQPELQIARAPAFMNVPETNSLQDPASPEFLKYAQNLVRYYNKGGFSASDGWHVSPSKKPIQLWGIYNEPSGNGLTPSQYVDMYNLVVPAMQSVDSSLHFVALELSDWTNEEQEYVPTFLRDVTGRVDVLGTHLYSSYDQLDADADVMATVPSFGTRIKYLYTQLKSTARFASVPVWVLENNVNADWALPDGTSNSNPGHKFVSDQRGSSAFFAAWRPYVFSQIGKAGAQALYQWDFAGDGQYGEINQSTGKPFLSYWVDLWLGRLFTSASPAQFLRLSNSDPANVEILAVKNGSGTITIMVVNHAVRNTRDNNGLGASLSVNLDLSLLGPFSTGTELMIDASTDTLNGPQTRNVVFSPQQTVSFNGYGVWFLTLKP